MKKERYEEPKMEIIEFSSKDMTVVASQTELGQDDLITTTTSVDY